MDNGTGWLQGIRPLRSQFWPRVWPRLLFFASVWLVLAGQETLSWFVGLPAVFLATALSLFLAGPAFFLSVRGFLRFFPYFLGQSFVSGLDVMIRVCSPGPRIDPGFLTYTTRLAPGPAQTFFANVISLLPGTLSAELRENQLTIHCLDCSGSALEQVQEMESRVAYLFCQFSAPGGDS